MNVSLYVSLNVFQDVFTLRQWLRTSEHLTGIEESLRLERSEKEKRRRKDEKKGDVYGWQAIC